MTKKDALKRSGPPASDLLEDAVRLLREAPAAALLLHPIGSVPCVLGALYFIADMSGSAFASGRLVPSSLTLAALYLWMKCWQAVFAAHLRAVMLREPPPRWTPRRILALAGVQGALQPLGLVLRPAALLLAIPYVWTATFFQNVSVLGDGEGPGLRDLCQRAWRQTVLWPMQMHALATLLFVFGLFVWLNVLIGLIFLPAMLKMLLGIETVFTRNFAGFFNPTFFLATLAGMYLCLDPLRKAAIVLRCFHGSSLRSGDDLAVQLRNLTRPLARAALVLFFAVANFASPLTPRAHAEAAPPAPEVNPEKLDRSIEEVLERREFAWRSPRTARELPAAEESWFGKMRRDFDEWVQRTLWKSTHWLGRMIGKLGDWLFGSKKSSKSHGDFLTWLGSVRVIALVLLGVAVVLLIVLLVRTHLRSRSPAVAAKAIASQPDLTDEDVTADQLPEDGWLQMARDLMDRGEFRLALRASYLAALAHLGQREIIRLARHKSNRDYDVEVRRRARANTELIGAFGENLRVFERSWYGEHDVTREVLGEFSQNLERIRAC